MGSAYPDPSRYYSREFMQLEWQRLWPRVWLLAGVTSDLPEARDYVTFALGHEEIHPGAPVRQRRQSVLQRVSASAVTACAQ
jgi:phenylpropionate dioxygenase-like ring-hydroxylating dioxygenase large terminal subunit